MEEWKKVKLREVISYMSKGIVPVYTEQKQDSIIVLNQKCNRDFKIDVSAARFHNSTLKKVAKDKILKMGDILINSTGTGTAGRVAQIEYLGNLATVDGHMIILRNNEKVTSLYLGYAVKQKQSMIEELAEGSTGQTEINKTRLLDEILISFPVSLNRQNKIALILKNIDDKITLNRRINDNLEQQAQALYKSWFVDFEPFKDGKFVDSELGRIPEGWRVGCIRDYCKVRSGYAFKSSWWTDSGEKIIKIKNITDNGKLDMSDCSYVLKANTLKAMDFKVNAGDVLIAMTGATIGKLCIIPYSQDDLYVNQRVGKFFIGNKPLKKLPFLYGILKQGKNIGEIINKGQGSAQPNISSSDIENVPIIIPDNQTMNTFNTFLMPLYSLILNNEHESLILSNKRDSLLPKLMSGELKTGGLHR